MTSGSRAPTSFPADASSPFFIDPLSQSFRLAFLPNQSDECVVRCTQHKGEHDARATKATNPILYVSLTLSETEDFTLNGVAPGVYKLFAWEGRTNTGVITERPYMNPDYIALYEGRGVSVVVDANKPVSGIRVPLIPADQ